MPTPQELSREAERRLDDGDGGSLPDNIVDCERAIGACRARLLALEEAQARLLCGHVFAATQADRRMVR